MTESNNQEEKQVVVASRKGGISFKRIIAGLSCAVVFGLAAYAWQENIFLGILAAVVAFVVGYFMGLLIY